MFVGKPIIGVAGGIGSGKSFVAGLFAEFGGLVLDSDAQVRQAYDDPNVLAVITKWWGERAFQPDGSANRAAIARIIFSDETERRRLEALIHPKVAVLRDRAMGGAARDARVKAYIWDTPLLFETGLNRQCDAVVFVDCPAAMRRERVAMTRQWGEADWRRRENLQWPLDSKRQMSDYVIHNTADAGYARSQVQAVFSGILGNGV